jgi:hypothetical protein
MKSTLRRILWTIAILALAACSVPTLSTRTPPPSPPQLARETSIATATSLPTASPTGSPTSPPAQPPATSSLLPATVTPTPAPIDPFTLISQDSLFAYLEGLTAIQPYSGWRNSATQGEAEAMDYVAGELGELAHLQDLGLELERQDFRVFMATELWDTRLHLTVDGQEVEVPADGLRGHRDNVPLGLRFDSDGTLNDSAPDPVVVQGPTLLIRSADEVYALRRRDVRDRVVFLDYGVLDRYAQDTDVNVSEVALELLSKEPAGLVLVTEFSNQAGESHGTFVADSNALTSVPGDAAPPILYARLEDLGPAGVHDWDDLAAIEAVRMTWDADVFSPARSGNLVARIPGADPSRAVLLGAHIDSPNSPGALDDGSGSVILLEVARVLDAAQVQPPTDLYLIWFGSEELGLYGSSHFAATHQDLLDRTQAMLQIDMLSHPLDGINADLSLISWSYGRLGDDRLLWPEHLGQAAADRGVDTEAEDIFRTYSDNSSLAGFDVPNADLIYGDEEAMSATGSLHYAAHIHDPYETVELARQQAGVFEQMARVALVAALEPPQDLSALRVTPPSDQRALFVASHTEPAHMAPTTLIDLGMALAWEGFDVDQVPYGQPVTTADLEDSALVIALPVADYPGSEGDPGLYDETWLQAEIDALEAYVEGGGLLVLANSAHRLKHGNAVRDPNEDWEDANALAERFGITYHEGTLEAEEAWTEGRSPMMDGVVYLDLAPGNGVPFHIDETADAQVLALADGEPAVALVNHGLGQVLVLADLGILGADWGEPDNLPFWQNLARYARE